MTQSALPLPLPSIPPISGMPAFKTLLSLPFLYGMSIPLFLLDIALFLYHLTVFPFLGIKRVPRKQYIRIDRHRLSYLPWVLKLGCAYCGYANGLLHYAVRIAGDTERYFCPSKHQETPEFHAPPHHNQFAEYGERRDSPNGFMINTNQNESIADEIMPSLSTNCRSPTTAIL